MRGGLLRGVLGGLGEVEAKVAYSHVSSLDAWDLEGIVSWLYRLGESGHYGYASVGGGVRHESIGSFGATRYPLGFGVGVRSLIAQPAGVRLEYQFRRILNDPIADFSEHQVLIGVSLFLRNK